MALVEMEAARVILDTMDQTVVDHVTVRTEEAVMMEPVAVECVHVLEDSMEHLALEFVHVTMAHVLME